MEKAIYYYSEDCVKCRFLEPHVEKRAEENWIKLEKRLYTIAENEITSVPMLLRNNTQYDYESIVYLLQKK